MNGSLRQSAEPLVSVVIPAYNAEKTLERAIVSVLQEKSIPFELIVVDDGSTDDTRERMQAFSGIHAPNPNRFIRRRRGEGFAVGRPRDRIHSSRMPDQCDGLYFGRR